MGLSPLGGKTHTTSTNLQLMFFWLKASEAAPKTATSVAPAATASSKPLALGVSTG